MSNELVERVAKAATLVDELTYAAKRLGFEEHRCDEELFDIQRVDKAKAAILDYIAALNEEISDLGDVAKGCAKREVAALSAIQQDTVAGEVERETYRQMHETARELGYPSILEALEDLDRLKIAALSQEPSHDPQ